MGHLVVSGQLPRKEKPAYIHPEAQPELVNEWK
jgi:agmatinase